MCSDSSVSCSCCSNLCCCSSILLLLQPRSFSLDITDGCGKTKGCYRNPPACSESACDIVVTWLRRNDRSYEFEMSAETDGWVALGLSDDKKMVCLCILLTLYSANVEFEVQ